MAILDSKFIIGAAFALPVVYIWQGWKWSFMLLLGLGAYAWYTFDKEYILKSEVRRIPVHQLGPEQEFRSPTTDWEFGPNGEPIPKHQVPPQQYPAPRYGRP